MEAVSDSDAGAVHRPNTLQQGQQWCQKLMVGLGSIPKTGTESGSLPEPDAGTGTGTGSMPETDVGTGSLDCSLGY